MRKRPVRQGRAVLPSVREPPRPATQASAGEQWLYSQCLREMQECAVFLDLEHLLAVASGAKSLACQAVAWRTSSYCASMLGSSLSCPAAAQVWNAAASPSLYPGVYEHRAHIPATL